MYWTLAPLFIGLTTPLSVFAQGAASAAGDDSETADPAAVDLRLDPATIAAEVQGYYEGERISTYIVGSLGVAAIATGIPLVIMDDDLARGAGWPLIILGALQGIGAIVYAFQVGDQMEHYGNALRRDPAAFRDEETAHMSGTIDRFVFYQLTEAILTLGGAGVATYGFLAGEDLAAGIGLGVGVLALPFLIIDLINQQRGAQYADHVRRMSVSPASNTSPAATLPHWGDGLDAPVGASAAGGLYLSMSRSF